MEVDYDRIPFAELDLAIVVCGDVEGEFEACGVGAIESGSGEVSEKRGCWG